MELQQLTQFNFLQFFFCEILVLFHLIKFYIFFLLFFFLVVPWMITTRLLFFTYSFGMLCTGARMLCMHMVRTHDLEVVGGPLTLSGFGCLARDTKEKIYIYIVKRCDEWCRAPERCVPVCEHVVRDGV